MRKKSFVISLFVILSAVSLLLALVLTPLRSYYPDNTSYLDKAIVLSGVDFKGKIKNSGTSNKTYENITSDLQLALVFSPLRSSKPDNTSYFDKAIVLSGVDFKGEIKNSGISNKTYENLTSDLAILNASRAKNKISYARGNNESKAKASGLFIKNASRNSKLTSGNSSNSTGRNMEQNVTPAIPTGMLSSVTLSSNKRKVSSKAVTRALIIPTTDLSSIKKTGTKLNVGGPPPDDGGGGGGTPSLPMGDGINFLLLLAIAFAGVKFRNSFS